MGAAEDIDQFEQALGELIIKYEQYFIGIEKREPLRLFEQVERLSQRYLPGAITNSMLRFRYNSLVARFTTYRQQWSRVTRLIEDGKYSRDRFKMKMHDRDKGLEAAPRSETAKPHEQKMDRLYQQYVAALTSCEMPSEGFSPEMIRVAIEKQRLLIMERFQCKEVDFRVVVEEGKPKIKARPIS